MWYADNDDDGYGDEDYAVLGCNAPLCFVDNSDDCDDTEEEVYPDASEICNGRLDDCNYDGELYELENGKSIPRTEWDGDADGFVVCTLDVEQENWLISSMNVVGGADCDDERDYVYPSAPEICNGQHDDCEEQVLTNGEIPSNEQDNDGDGMLSVSQWCLL